MKLKDRVGIKNNFNVILSAVNKVLCFFIGHDYRVVGRSNGNAWGWNDLECQRCKKESDTLTE